MLTGMKRIFPVFLAVTMLFVVIMLCCVRSSDSRIDMTAATAQSADTAAAAQAVSTGGSHVSHSGELRGVWVPYFTLTNGGTSMTEEEFKAHFDEIVRTAKDYGMNALFVHVRSHCDAVYPSEYYPFSAIFTGTQGEDPGYDPLEYMVETTHNAGLEFHAWINPYRVQNDGNPSELSEDNPCYIWLNDDDEENDRNIIEYDGGLYLNPAKAEVRSLIIAGVRELVENYDVDGIHLDDYFYPFTESEYDDEDYSEYLGGVSDTSKALTLTNWRCANVSVLISGIYAAVKNIDSNVAVGISPQGNMDNDIGMGADIYTWCSQKGFIDYIAPQIYYNSENTLLPYEETVDSWRGIITEESIELYIGLALYKAGSDEDGGTWAASDTIISEQIEYSRELSGGFILYSWEYLTDEQSAQEVANMEEIITGS